MAGDGGVGPRQRWSPGLCQYRAALRRAAEDLAPAARIPHDASWADPVSPTCSAAEQDAAAVADEQVIAQYLLYAVNVGANELPSSSSAQLDGHLTY